jgi:hypothetical protein
MALTDNRTQLQDCENVNEVAGDSSADPQSNTSEAGVVIQGTNALQFQVTNAQEYLAYDQDSAGATFNLDLSDSTIYMMIKDNLHDSFANLGGQCVLADTADGVSTTVIGYAVAGYDVIGLPYEKKYSAMKLDVSVVVAAPGVSGTDFFQHAGTEASLDQTIIKQVGYGSIHLIKGQGTIPNTFFDGIYYIANGSYAASITGGTVGTPETMTDLVGDDVTVGAGMFANPKGSEYNIFAPTEWGAATGDTYFEGTDEQWYYLGDNGGGHAVGATHFPMRLLGGTGTNSFAQTRVTNINTGTRAEFDWSDANFDIIALDTTTWIDFGAITCPVEDVDKNCDAGTFINCDQMILNGMNMDSNTWIGSTDAGGAVLLSVTPTEADNQTNSTFISDGTGHAMEISLNTASLTTYSLSGLTTDGFAGQSGTAGNRVFLIDNALDGDVTINISDGTALNVVGGGSGFSYEVAAGYTGTVSINQTVTLTVTVTDSAGAVVEGASVRIENASTGAQIAQGTTNASGVFTDATYNYGGDLSVRTKVRLKGYKPFRTLGTIISTGISVGVTLQTDSIVDLP